MESPSAAADAASLCLLDVLPHVSRHFGDELLGARITEVHPSIREAADVFERLVTSRCGLRRRSPLDAAAAAGHVGRLSTLLKLLPARGAGTDATGMTALHYAARGGHAPAVEVLLAARRDARALNAAEGAYFHVDVRDLSGLTPLHYASVRGHEHVARALLAAGADTRVRCNFGFLPSDLARAARHPSVSALVSSVVEGSRPFVDEIIQQLHAVFDAAAVAGNETQFGARINDFTTYAWRRSHRNIGPILAVQSPAVVRELFELITPGLCTGARQRLCQPYSHLHRDDYNGSFLILHQPPTPPNNGGGWQPVAGMPEAEAYPETMVPSIFSAYSAWLTSTRCIAGDAVFAAHKLVGLARCIVHAGLSHPYHWGPWRAEVSRHALPYLLRPSFEENPIEELVLDCLRSTESLGVFSDLRLHLYSSIVNLPVLLANQTDTTALEASTGTGCAVMRFVAETLYTCIFSYLCSLVNLYHLPRLDSLPDDAALRADAAARGIPIHDPFDWRATIELRRCAINDAVNSESDFGRILRLLRVAAAAGGKLASHSTQGFTSLCGGNAPPLLRTALADLLVSSGHKLTVHDLVAAAGKDNVTLEHLLDLPASKALLDTVACATPIYGHSQSCKCNFPKTALGVAVRAKRVDNVVSLLRAGADVNFAVNADSPTPIIIAASVGAADILQVLADNGADVFAETTSGCSIIRPQSLLHRGDNLCGGIGVEHAVAAMRPHSYAAPIEPSANAVRSLVKALLLEKGGAEWEQRFGKTVELLQNDLALAILQTPPDEVAARELIAHGVRLPPLHGLFNTAIQKFKPGLKAFPDVFTMLRNCMNVKDVEEMGVVRLLVDAGVSVDQREAFGFTALMQLCCDKTQDAARWVALLVDAGADVNARSDGGRTPLHIAAGSGNHDVIAPLVAAGADLRARDRQGRTPLLIAVWPDRTRGSWADVLPMAVGQTVKALLAAGADVLERTTFRRNRYDTSPGSPREERNALEHLNASMATSLYVSPDVLQQLQSATAAAVACRANRGGARGSARGGARSCAHGSGDGRGHRDRKRGAVWGFRAPSGGAAEGAFASLSRRVVSSAPAAAGGVAAPAAADPGETAGGAFATLARRGAGGARSATGPPAGGGGNRRRHRK